MMYNKAIVQNKGDMPMKRMGYSLASVCLLLWLLAGGTALKASAAPAPWMLCGGMLGVTVVLLLNITVPRIAPSA